MCNLIYLKLIIVTIPISQIKKMRLGGEIGGSGTELIPNSNSNFLTHVSSTFFFSVTIDIPYYISLRCTTY